MTEKEVREIVKSVISSHMKDIPTKEQIIKISKDEADKSSKKVFDEKLTTKEVKEMIKDTLLSYHRWMWDKKGIWMNQI
jgi:lipoate-protein ligase A